MNLTIKGIIIDCIWMWYLLFLYPWCRWFLFSWFNTRWRWLFGGGYFPSFQESLHNLYLLQWYKVTQRLQWTFNVNNTSELQITTTFSVSILNSNFTGKPAANDSQLSVFLPTYSMVFSFDQRVLFCFHWSGLIHSSLGLISMYLLIPWFVPFGAFGTSHRP